MKTVIAAASFMGDIITMDDATETQMQPLTRRCVAELFYFHRVLSDENKKLFVRYVCGGDPGGFDRLIDYDKNNALAYLEAYLEGENKGGVLPPFFRLALDNKVVVAFINHSGITVIEADTAGLNYADADAVAKFLKDTDTFDLVVSVCMACQDKRIIVYNTHVLHCNEADLGLYRLPTIELSFS